jgi:hypothetical protein
VANGPATSRLPGEGTGPPAGEVGIPFWPLRGRGEILKSRNAREICRGTERGITDAGKRHADARVGHEMGECGDVRLGFGKLVAIEFPLARRALEGLWRDFFCLRPFGWDSTRPPFAARSVLPLEIRS